MSELQKFENSESWREKLRNFLLKENEPQQKNSVPPESREPRYSFDVSEDLLNLIEAEKKKKMATKTQQMATKNTKTDCENKENINMALPSKNTNLMADETLLAVKTEISDDSFEAMELICNKTASDPNSTLFQYLNADQEIKKAIKQERKGFVAEAKKRHSGNEPSETAAVEQDAESAAIDCRLNDLRMLDSKEEAYVSPFKEVEMTQIEDIEAPSRFWDNDTILQTSPVKMVGLLRPSTIVEDIEEPSHLNDTILQTSPVRLSDVSSTQTSFKSAVRYPQSEVSGSCYLTASETTTFDEQKENKVKVEPDLHTTVNLIDLEKTMHETAKDFGHEDHQMPSGNVEKLIDLTLDTDARNDSNESEESVIELLSDDEPSADQQSIALIKFEDVSLNAAEQDISTSSTASKEHSLHFNDTLEEVEYMMQKGLEYMAGAGITPKQSPFKPQTLPSAQKLNQMQHTFTVSPAKSVQEPTQKEVLAPFSNCSSPARSAHKSPSKLESRFALNIKPFPKLDIFKKPMSATKSATKTIPRPKDKFAHVISPIGTYIKKTPEARLISGIKTGSDEKNSSVFRALEFESRMHKPNFGHRKAEQPKSPNPRSLPKKAYIASEFRQVVDQRNAVTIPGGKNLQKYLDTAILPSVIQHDGKANMPSGSSKLPFNSNKISTSDSQLPKRSEIKNDSLANLSVVTGDVSLYTIKDAQKL